MKHIFSVIALLILFVTTVRAQSTYLRPQAGGRHVYTAMFDTGGYLTRWYVATDREGTRAKYNDVYYFDYVNFGEGIEYDGESQALVGTDLKAVSIQWGTDISVGDVYYVFVEVEGNGCTNRMAVKVTVSEGLLPINMPPVTQADTVQTFYGEPVYIDVLANDYDPDGDSIYTSQASIFTSGATAVVVNHDSLFYTPAPGFLGVDTLIYRVCDVVETLPYCVYDTVIVNVRDHIVAVNDTVQMLAGNQASTYILDNDTFSVSVITSIIDYPTYANAYIAIGQRLVVSSDGSYYGRDSLAYTITNPGGIDTAWVIIDIKPWVDASASAYCMNGEARVSWHVEPHGFTASSLDITFTQSDGELLQQFDGVALSGVYDWLDIADIESFTLNMSIADIAGLETTSIGLLRPYCTANGMVALRDTFEVLGEPTTFDVLANDYDPEGEGIDSSSLVIYIDENFTGPYHGTAIPDGRGNIIFTPDDDFSGIDSLIYMVCDASTSVACDTAMVIFTIYNNSPIVARDDYSTIFTGQTARVDILSNDYDREGHIDTTSIIQIDDPENGNAVIFGGVIIYQPLAGFEGRDSLLYSVCDTDIPLSCDSAWVFFTVIRNSGVVVNVDSVSTFVETDLVIEPLANDYDVDGVIDTASLSIVQNPKSGIATVAADGKVLYRPEVGFVGIDSFSYRVCDTGYPVMCGSAYVYVTVEDNNLGVVAVRDDVYLLGGEQVVVQVLANDYDPDTISNIVPSSVVIVTPPLSGAAVVNADGSITYSPNENNVAEIDSLLYRVCDDAPIVACDTAWVVFSANKYMPPVAVSDSVYMYIDDKLSIQILVNDKPLVGTIDTSATVVVRNPMNGSVTVDPVTSVITYEPVVCFAGVDSFSYVIYSSFGIQSNVATVYVTVTIDPTRDSDGDTVLDIDEDVVGSGNLCDSDTDNDGIPNYLDDDDDNDGIPTVDEIDDLNGNGIVDYLENWMSRAVDDIALAAIEMPVTIDVLLNDSATMNPSSLYILTNPTSGFVNIDADYNVVYTPDLTFEGVDVFEYVVCDYYNVCDTAKVDITVDDIVACPELFTPNGDGKNDYYIIGNVEKYPSNYFVVYNRWGNKVYEKSNYANDWDGYSNMRGSIGNRQLPVGVYYYIFKYGSNGRVKQGGLYIER